MRPLSLHTVDELRRKLDALPTDGPVHVLLEAFARWRDDASRFGAAIAFHAVLALVGSGVLAAAFASAWLRVGSAQGMHAIASMGLGGIAIPGLHGLIEAASRHSFGLAAILAALIATGVGVAGVSAQLRRGFNAMADSPTLPSLAPSVLARRLAGTGMVCAAGLAILTAMAISGAVGALTDSLAMRLPQRVLGLATALSLFDWAVAAALLTLAFVGLLQQLPDKPADAGSNWMAGSIGACAVAVLIHGAGRGLRHAEFTTISGMVEAALVGMLIVYCGVQALLFAAALAASAHEAHGHRTPAANRREPRLSAGPVAIAAIARSVSTTSLAAFRARNQAGAERRQPAPAPKGKSAVLLQFPKHGQIDGKSRRTP